MKNDELNPNYIDNERNYSKMYSLPTLNQLNDNKKMKVIFWYDYSVGSCFYDSVKFCIERSKWKHLVDKYSSGLELRIDSLNWTMNLKKTNPLLFDKFFASYLDITEVTKFDNSDDQDDTFNVSCVTIDEHVKKMLSYSQEYCRTIDIVIISTFLNIDVHIFSCSNGNLFKRETTIPLDKNVDDNELRAYVTLYLGNYHYNPIMTVMDRFDKEIDLNDFNNHKLIKNNECRTINKQEDKLFRYDDISWNITSSTQFVLNEEEEDLTQSFFDLYEPNYNICSYNGDVLTQRSYNTLKPGVWLNDEVINLYSKMVVKELQNKGEKIHLYRSHFWSRLSSEDGVSCENVKRWSRNVFEGDIFKLNKLFIPINLNDMHWILAVIYINDKRIQIYDSMHGPGYRILNKLLDYLKFEFQDKKKNKGSWSEWQLVPCKDDTPSQENGYDCGVFVCMFIHYIAENRELNFNQRDINNYRKFIAYHLANSSYT